MSTPIPESAALPEPSQEDRICAHNIVASAVGGFQVQTRVNMALVADVVMRHRIRSTKETCEPLANALEELLANCDVDDFSAETRWQKAVQAGRKALSAHRSRPQGSKEAE